MYNTDAKLLHQQIENVSEISCGHQHDNRVRVDCMQLSHKFMKIYSESVYLASTRASLQLANLRN